MLISPDNLDCWISVFSSSLLVCQKRVIGGIAIDPRTVQPVASRYTDELPGPITTGRPTIVHRYAALIKKMEY
jgi:hypothetical protein